MRKVSGLTLIELVTVLAVTAILLAVVTPSVESILANNRSSAYANDLLSALRLARAEAINRGVSMSLCARASSTSTSSCGLTWSNGWMLFTDGRGGAGAGTLASSGEEVVKVWPAPKGSATIVTTPANTGYVRFLPNGGRDQSNGASALAIRFADCTGNQDRTLAVSPTGFVDVSKNACP